MYLEFELPETLAYYINGQLNNYLDQWAEKYQVTFKSKIVKYRKRITFEQDALYDLFLMTWQPMVDETMVQNFRPRLVVDLNHKL